MLKHSLANALFASTLFTFSGPAMAKPVDQMLCKAADGKLIKLDAKNDVAKQKQCISKSGTWVKASAASVDAASAAPKKEEAPAKAGGW